MIGNQTEMEPRKKWEVGVFRPVCRQKAVMFQPLHGTGPSLCQLWGSCCWERLCPALQSLAPCTWQVDREDVPASLWEQSLHWNSFLPIYTFSPHRRAPSSQGRPVHREGTLFTLDCGFHTLNFGFCGDFFFWGGGVHANVVIPSLCSISFLLNSLFWFWSLCTRLQISSPLAHDLCAMDMRASVSVAVSCIFICYTPTPLVETSQV